MSIVRKALSWYFLEETKEHILLISTWYLLSSVTKLSFGCIYTTLCTCLRYRVDHVTSKGMTLGVNEVCDAGMRAHNLLIINTLTHTCLGVYPCPQGGLPCMEEVKFFSWGDVQKVNNQREMEQNVLSLGIRCITHDLYTLWTISVSYSLHVKSTHLLRMES